MVPEVYQVFWAGMPAGEFINDAAIAAGSHRKQGTRWLAAVGGVRPRRGRNLKGRCLTLAQREEIALGRARGDAEIKRLEATGETENPRYEELLMEHFYRHHLLRMPPNEWPEPVTCSMSHLNRSIYVPMQGPASSAPAASCRIWDRSADLPRVHIPTLVIGAANDTMDPAHLEAMAHQLPNGRYHHCPNGSHLAHIDDQQTYFEGLLRFLWMFRVVPVRVSRPIGYLMALCGLCDLAQGWITGSSGFSSTNQIPTLLGIGLILVWTVWLLIAALRERGPALLTTPAPRAHWAAPATTAPWTRPRLRRVVSCRPRSILPAAIDVAYV
jgi:proline iminopeptidase